MFNRAYSPELDLDPASAPSTDVLGRALSAFWARADEARREKLSRADVFAATHTANSDTRTYVLPEMDGDVQDLLGLSALIGSARRLGE